jgi:hypothetical protein
MSATPRPSAPPEPVKAWIGRHDPIIQFLTDDGSLYAAQHNALSATSPEPERLEVKAPPHGTIVITGPAARELCNCLCAGQATLIRTDGTDLLSVECIPEDVEL